MTILFFPHLLLINSLFPGTCTSTLPNKARYPLLRLFVSEEACRPLFLVVAVAMKNFLSGLGSKQMTIWALHSQTQRGSPCLTGESRALLSQSKFFSHVSATKCMLLPDLDLTLALWGLLKY